MTEQQHPQDPFPDQSDQGWQFAPNAPGLSAPPAGLGQQPMDSNRGPRPQQSQYPGTTDTGTPLYPAAWTPQQAEHPHDQGRALAWRPELQPAPTKSTRRRLVAITGAVAVVTAAIVGGSLFGYNHGVSTTKAGYAPIASSQAAQASSQAAQLSSQAAQVSSQAAQVSSQAAQASSVAAASAASQAEDAALPDLESIAARFPALDPDSVYATSVAVTITGTDSTDKLKAIGGFMGTLGFTTATVDRMMNTRAVDGTQTAEGKNCNLSWTYSPDAGLQLVFEARVN